MIRASSEHLIRSLLSFQIEDVTAAQLEILVQQQNYLAVFFCKFELSHLTIVSCSDPAPVCRHCPQSYKHLRLTTSGPLDILTFE